MVEVSTSVAVAVPEPSLVVMVRVAEPAALVYFTVANVALICANVPVSVMLVDVPVIAALPAVAANVPLLTTKFTVIEPEPMSASDTLSPVNVVATLGSIVNVVGSVLTGASFTAVTLMVLVDVLLKLLAADPSSTCHVNVRVALLTVGVSLVLAKVTPCNTALYCATVAEPVKLSLPVTASYEPVMPLAAVNANTSPVVKPEVICTVAPTRLVLSTSLKSRSLLATMAAAFSV